MSSLGLSPNTYNRAVVTDFSCTAEMLIADSEY